MDITSLFKASVKTARLKLPPGSIKQQDKNRILAKKSSTPTHEIWSRAKSLKHQVTLLRNFLLDNRASYMQLAEHLKNAAPPMTDEERELIDRESEKILSNTAMVVGDLRRELQELRVHKQAESFLNLVIESLAEYANGIRKIALEQKKFRLRRKIETIEYIKLQPKMKTDILNRPLETAPAEALADRPTGSGSPVAPRRAEVVPDMTRSGTDKTIALSSTIDDLEESTTMDDEYEGNDLSPEDIQMFESENIQLYNELKGLSEEVEQIQRNVSDIAHLQDIFTEKVSIQKGDIEHISTNAVGSTENIKDANEQIRQSIQRNAGLRVWVLFFFIVMSFTLLFLDWYND
ncbi:syntaxin-18-like [Anopheles albimanus]|uniref:Syntaxin-18 n=1 Tax=Anopheles albimanus TaxID=7167 RepID=A0A182FKK6_ANOAL|nr:syntaxin-18-like [Anopheles albimanus]